MKLLQSKRNRLVLAAVAFAGIATPSFALFGLGDIVFDPTNYAQLVTQATTAYSHYNAFMSNVKHFTVKNSWRTAISGLELFDAASQFGETAGLGRALNTSHLESAIQAWGNTSVKLEAAVTPLIGSQRAGGPQQAMLAMIEASDAISPQCLNAVGSYRQARSDSAAAQAQLQNDQFDASDETNSEVQQLNLLNAAEAQHMTELQSQGVVHSCIASQMTVANMQQRNAAAHDLNTWGFVQEQRAVNNASPAGSSSTWTTYLP